MSIEFHVLGAAGRDNAVLCYIHTGQGVARVLFDCGDAVLAGLPFAEIQRIDHLCFSHLHMDHIGGFDSFFRCTYNRTLRPNVIYGPPETARILHHRFQGFLWNLHAEVDVPWRVADVHADHLAWTRFSLSDAFAGAQPEGTAPFGGTVVETPAYSVIAVHLHHLTPSLGFIVREAPRLNVDTTALAELGLPGGPWIKALKAAPPEQEVVVIEGVAYPLAELRASLLVEQPGDCVAYLTDFLLDEPTMQMLAPLLAGCRVIICESAYRQADSELATHNAHLTAPQAAELAARAGVGRLVLIHLSDRYPPEEWPELLAEARAIFPETHFPKGWGIEG